jgi:hypothetical protein
MKQLLIGCLALMASILPALAQVDHDYNANDKTPEESFGLTKDKIPLAVLKAASTTFDMSNPVSWTRFPYALKEYGWVYDEGASDLKPNRFEVKMKLSNGDELYAVYSAEGNLIATREITSNVAVPASVQERLSKSQYKNWKIVGTKEVIRYYHDKNSVEQHFRVTVEKDNVKRSISFNYQGTK